MRAATFAARACTIESARRGHRHESDRLLKAATLTATAAAALTLGGAFAWADGGYYAGALGARASGRAGAFAARADDVTAVHYNPAGLVKLRGTVLQIGNRLSHNAYSYTRATTVDFGDPMTPTVSFDPVRNAAPWQPLEPFLGAASDLGTRSWVFALAAFAPPGISRYDFPSPTNMSPPGAAGQRYMMVQREAIILNYGASAAWRFRDLFGIGATLQWITVPRLVYSLVIEGNPLAGAANPVSSELDILAVTSGSDAFTPNAIVGGWVRPLPFLEIGVAGQVLPAQIATNSRLAVTPLNPTLGEVVLTRDGERADDVSVRLPLPLLARGGVRYLGFVGGRERFDVELDVEYETWSRVKNFTVESNRLVANVQGQAVNINRIVVDKQWRDTVALKFGGDALVIPDRWAIRAGVYYETAVAAPAYAHVDFAGGHHVGASFGTSWLLRRWEIALGYQLRHQPAFSVSEATGRVYQQVPSSACMPPYTDTATCHPNYLGQPSPTVNAGRYAANSHFVSLAVLYRFGQEK
jgi:long-chain fatty acid transport protein